MDVSSLVIPNARPVLPLYLEIVRLRHDPEEIQALAARRLPPAATLLGRGPRCLTSCVAGVPPACAPIDSPAGGTPASQQPLKTEIRPSSPAAPHKVNAS